MKIVFFGTGEFSATILKGLIDNNHNVVAVVSQPDKVNARNNKIVFSSIKKYCLENNLPIPEPVDLNKYSGKFVVRIPKSLHRTISEQSKMEGLSLNQYVANSLAYVAGQKQVLLSK